MHVQYRLVNDYLDARFIGPRVLDKLIITMLIVVLYHNKGSMLASSNVNNISSILFMWATLPGFTTVSYIPSIFLDRPIFRRYPLSYSSTFACNAIMCFDLNHCITCTGKERVACMEQLDISCSSW
jgi:hypothetical protein